MSESTWTVLDDSHPDNGWRVVDENIAPEKPVGAPEARFDDSLHEYVGTVLKNASEPTFWEQVKEFFNPLNDDARARASVAVINAEETNRAFRRVGSSRRVGPGDFDRTLLEDFKTGLQGSVSGLAVRQALPEGPPPEVEKYLPTNNRLARQGGTLLGDFPFMAMGMVLGGGPETPTGWGGSFALPEGLRKVYMDRIEKGEVSGWKDFSERLGGAVWATLKGEATGIATNAAGMAAGPLRVPAEVAAMTSVSAGLEGRIPEPQEFLDAAILIGGMHGAGAVASKLRGIYARTGKRPAEVAQDAAADPSIRDDVLSSRKTPRVYNRGIRRYSPDQPVARISEGTAKEINRLGFETAESDVIIPEKTIEHIDKATGKRIDLDDIDLIAETIEHPSEVLPNIGTKNAPYREGSVLLVHQDSKFSLSIVEVTPGEQGNVLWNFWRMSTKKGERYLQKFRDEKARRVSGFDEQSGGATVDAEASHPSSSSQPAEAGTGQPEGLPGSRTARESDKNISTQEKESKPTKSESLAREGTEYDRHLPSEGDAPTNPAEPGEINAGAVIKKSDIVKALRDKLTAPIRIGRMGSKSKNVLGFYKLRPEVIRTRFANDISTTMHEYGHHLHNTLWGMDKNALEPFRKELAPLATVGHPLEEGLAEFASLYVADPAKAEAKAPMFYAKWEKALKKDAPEVLEALHEAQAAVEAWIKQPAEQKVLSSISVNENTRNRATFDEIHSYLWDDLRFLDKAVRRITGKKWWYFGPFGKGEKLPAHMDPYKLARTLRGTPGRAQQWLYHSPYRFADYSNVGKSFADILKPVGKQIDAFRAYIVSKRALELHERDIKSGVDVAAARATVGKWEGEFGQAFKELKEYQDLLLQYQRDSGLLSVDGYNLIKELNKDYVPFQRMMEGVDKGAGTGRGMEAWNPTKRIKGSTRDIYDPLESIIKNTYMTLELSEKNAALRALVDLTESRQGQGDVVEKIPAPQIGTHVSGAEMVSQMLKVLPREEAIRVMDAIERGDVDLDVLGFSVFRPKAFTPEADVISVWKNGKREFYQVDPDLGRAIKALDRETTNMLVRFLSKPTEWLRAGATLSPDFMPRNIIRDQLSAGIFSESGYKPFLDYTRGIFSAIKADEHYQSWLKGGGATTFLHSMDRNYMQENLHRMLHDTPVWNKVNPYKWLQMLSEFSEMGTRVGEARRVLKKAGTGRAGSIEAGYSAREVSLDFSRAGSKGRFLNNLITFFNASMQGLDKLGRKFRENPAGASARAFVSITIPSLMLAWYNRDNEKIQEQPQWQKDLFWMFEAGDVIWRIPKPFDIGMLFGTLPERIFDYAYTNDPDAMDNFMSSLLMVSSPGMMPTATLPIIENVTGYSFFLGRDIVPQSVEGRMPEYQYSAHTLELTKALSKVVGSLPAVKDMPMSQKDAWLPPAKVENLIRGWSGGLGYYALQLVDLAGRKAGILPDPVKASKTLADMPVIKAFTVRWPTANAESVTKFYERYAEFERYWKTGSDLYKKEFRSDAETLRLMELGLPYKQLKRVADAMSNVRGLIRGVDQLSNISADEKREIIDSAYLQLLAMAQAGNSMIDEFKKITEEESEQ
ncbi:MAG: LPD38 domain-containing protein [Pseudodesulfovibrio sp.]|uniref:LPD38 domain-containing protein n=1 Tax=Pseudodesulfovibrio sp. TaxID=2035812 RepID=UPI003D0A9E3D